MDPKGNAFKYDYDKKHRVTGAASAAGMKYTFVYDDYGNPVTARTVDPSAETDAKKAMTQRRPIQQARQKVSTWPPRLHRKG